MTEWFPRFAEKQWYQKLQQVLGAPWFAFALAAVLLPLYYMGFTLAQFYVLGAVGCIVLLFCKDVSTLMAVFLFMNTCITRQDTPSSIQGGSSFFENAGNLVQLGVLITVFVACFVVRFVFAVQRRPFRMSPLAWCAVALGVVLLTNGLFSSQYQGMSTLYGLMMSFYFTILFVMMSHIIEVDETTIQKLSYSFLAFSAALVFVLLMTYLTNPLAIQNGQISKEDGMVFGWGIWNTMGTLTSICIAPVLYLAYRSKRGYLYYIYAIVLVVACYFSASRQAMLAGTLAFVVGALVLLIKGKQKKVNWIISGTTLAIIAVVVLVVGMKAILHFFGIAEGLTDENGDFTGNGRTALFVQAINNFLSSPVFGAGFFAHVEDYYFVGLDEFVPVMYCNTLLQMMAGCGVIGLVVYVGYRLVSVWGFLQNPTIERAYLGLSVATLLVASLFDNHIFYMLPTLIYVMQLCVLDQTRGKDLSPKQLLATWKERAAKK